MPTLEDLKRRIESTEDLQSVVKTMKALTAVNSRQRERQAGITEELQDIVSGFEALRDDGAPKA